MLRLIVPFRIAFTRDLLQRSPLVGKIDPSDILILQEEIGTVASETQGTTCAMIQVKITTSSGKVIILHASVWDKQKRNVIL